MGTEGKNCKGDCENFMFRRFRANSSDGDRLKEDERGGSFSRFGQGEKFDHNFNGRIERKETLWES